MSHNQEETPKAIENVEIALSRTEQFIESKQKYFIWGTLAVVVVVLLGFGYNSFIYQPKVEEAAASMFRAEQYFQQDSLNFALYGDGQEFGFLRIIDEYSGTPSAKLAKYYAGMSFLALGEFDKAIENLEGFSSNDTFLSTLAAGAIGDAFMQKGDVRKAASNYMKAANNTNDKMNAPVYLMKAGAAYEALGQFASALKVYKTIQNEYTDSREYRTIEKYIVRVEALGKK